MIRDPNKTQRYAVYHHVPDEEIPVASRALLAIVCGLVAASAFFATAAAYLLW